MYTPKKLESIVNGALGLGDLVDVQQQPLPALRMTFAQHTPLIDPVDLPQVPQVTASGGIECRQPVGHVHQVVAYARRLAQSW